MKVMAVVNPMSANGRTARRWNSYEKSLRSIFDDFDFKFTTAPMEATKITREAINKGYEFIISVGGDGTLNEVVNGFFSEGRVISEKALLGVISTGTGSDFIKTIGFPKNLEDIETRFKKLQTRKSDIGVVRFFSHTGNEVSRYFINIADFGIGGETVDRVNRTTKAFGGFASFLWGTITTLFRYKNKPVKIKIDNREIIEQKIFAGVVANGRFFGGGMMIAPSAQLDDGLFDIVIVGDITKSQIIKYGGKIYTGGHINMPGVKVFRGRVVEAESSERVLLDIDGEQPGVLPARFEIIPSAINVVV